jgi:hypothetical protein
MPSALKIDAEPYPFEFQPENCALLIIDMQRDFLEPGGFGEMLGNDVSQLRRPQGEASEQAVSNINSLLDRVAGSSVGEIDRLIVDLRNVRDFLHTEGERVQREITSYAQLSSVAMTSIIWRVFCSLR